MNRLAGIIVVAVGFIIAILGAMQIVPGLTGAGVAIILLGALVIGLSFIDRPDTEGVERMSTASTLTNIFFAPTQVFQNLRRHPRWLAALLILFAASTIFINLFFYRITPKVITNYTLDKTLEMSLINDEAKKQIEGQRQKSIEEAESPVSRISSALVSGTALVYGMAFLGLVFFIFGMAMGGKINYWQAFSVAVYASFPVGIIRHLLNTLVLFIKDPRDIHPIIGQSSLIQDSLSFLFSAKDHPVLFSVVGMFSVLTIYWMWLNATGLKNAGERITGTIGWSASITIFAALLILVTVMAFMFPSFIS